MPEPKIDHFRGASIVQIALSNSLKIRLSNDWMISLEGDTWLTDADGVREVLAKVYDDPVENPAQFASLIGATVSAAVVAEDGSIVFDLGGTQLEVIADPRFEVWQLHGPLGQLVVCGPDAEISEWGPRVDESSP